MLGSAGARQRREVLLEDVAQDVQRLFAESWDAAFEHAREELRRGSVGREELLRGVVGRGPMG